MTVHSETPVVVYVGNDVTTDFSFSWSCGDPSENYVSMDGILLTEGVEYELEDFTLAYGGTMVFYEAPASGIEVKVYRDTPITQELNYDQGES